LEPAAIVVGSTLAVIEGSPVAPPVPAPVELAALLEAPPDPTVAPAELELEVDPPSPELEDPSPPHAASAAAQSAA
jgi:hypothetical protein